MDNKYTPVELTDIFPDFDSEKFAAVFNTKTTNLSPKIATLDFLLEGLSFSADTIKNQDIFLRNYIYCTVIARKHLLEIDNRLKIIKQRKSKIGDQESYSFKKLKYFEKKNEDAKRQITDFICYGIIDYIGKRNDTFSDLIDRNKEEAMWIIGPTYDYQYNSQYYDPDYDFSTFAKFYNVPNVPLIKFLMYINEMISLKSVSVNDYFSKVKETVEKNDLLSKMVERVSKNYHMHQRKELFESLLTLFNDKKYLAFVVNATIQLEGMFYELVSIKYGKKENQGTLVEKVDKAFDKNQILKHTLYPYFAFDVPDLRNQAAHKGLVDNENIEMLAYELLLDLNCLVSLVEKESIDKYKTILVIREKLNELDSNAYEQDKEYYMDLSKTLLSELYISDKTSSPFFWELIVDPQQFEDELNYYIPAPQNDDMVYLKNVVYAVSNLIRKEEFWQIVLDSSENISTDNDASLNDFGMFIKKLKNMFIPRLQGEAKNICCQVNKKIQDIEYRK